MKKVFLLIGLLLANTAAAYDTATGAYVQDRNVTEASSDLFDPLYGFYFDGAVSWGPGDFSTYTWYSNTPTVSAANLMQQGSYANAHQLVCYSGMSLDGLESPVHVMHENFSVDSSRMKYYETGSASDCSQTLRLDIEKNAVSYVVYTDYIPIKRIYQEFDGGCVGADCYIDFEYRGKMPFMGGEYFVKDVDGDTIYIAGGMALNASSSGWSSSYEGYKFKVHQVVTDGSDSCDSLYLDVQKPDASVVEVEATRWQNAVVDALEIAVLTAESGSTQKASLIVYDLSSQTVLEDGEDLEMNGQVWKDWQVSFNVVDSCSSEDEYADAECPLEYAGMDADQSISLLKSIILSYNHDLDDSEALEVGESLLFPSGMRLFFKGYSYDNFRAASCPVSGAVYSTFFVGTSEPGITSTTTTTTSTSSSSPTTSTVPSCPYSGGRSATGAFVQDTDLSGTGNLYDPNVGLKFDGSQTYSYGDFTFHQWCGQSLGMTMGAYPLELNEDNYDSLLCYQGAVLSGLEHAMAEKIGVNSGRLWYYEPGSGSECSQTAKLALPNGSVSYVIETDCIPLESISLIEDYGCAGADCLIDTEYRGRMPFMGEEYFVRDASSTKLYLDKGMVLDNVTNEGFFASYGGYKFKVSSYSTSGSCDSITLSVQKPSGSTVSVTVSGTSNAAVDSLEIAGLSWKTGGTWKGASIIVYNKSTEVVLEDGQDVIVRGQTKTGWKARFVTISNCYEDEKASDGSYNTCWNHEEYYDMAGTQAGLLKLVNITYQGSLTGTSALDVNESLLFPDTYRLAYKGYMDQELGECSDMSYSTYYIGTAEQASATATTSTTTTHQGTSTSTGQTTSTAGQCTISGDDQPCGAITLSEVVSHINRWSAGNASLSDVIALINAWAAG